MKDSQVELIIANIFAAAGIVIYGSTAWAGSIAIFWIVFYLISKRTEQP